MTGAESSQGAALDFLAGGGQMGVRMRAFPWHTTALGSPLRWPAALKIALRMMLNTRHPVHVFWGPEALFFYNDACLPIMGPERQGPALGRPAQEVWSEIWYIIGPQITQVMSGGEATWQENHKVAMHRHGRVEDAYFTYSYSPIDDPEAPAGVGGVLAITTETTASVQAQQEHAFALRLSAALDGTGEAAEMVDVVCAAVAEQFGAAQVNFATLEPATGRMRLRLRGRSREEGIGPELCELDESALELWQALKRGEMRSLSERRSPIFVGSTSAATLNAQPALLLVPSIPSGRLNALMILAHEEARVWSASDEVMLRDTCARLGAAMLRAEAEARVRASEEALRANDERLRLATEVARVGIWEIDFQTGTGSWSSEALGISGLKRRHFTAEDWTDIAHPDDRPRVLEHWERSLREGVPYEVEFRSGNSGKNGREGWLLSRGGVVRDARGEPLRAAGILIDISSRRRAEQALAESRARLALALEGTNDGLWDWDLVRDQVYHSPRFCEMLGYRHEEWESSYENWIAHTHPDDVAGTEAILRAYLAGERPDYVNVFRMRHKDGSWRWMMSRAKVFRDAEGKPMRMVGAHTDVTAQREAESELHMHREALERLVESRTAELLRAAEERRRAEEAMRQSEKLAALGQLTGGVAHDFNNILQVIMSGVALLRMPNLSEARRESVVDRIERAGQTARELTDRLLAFARRKTLRPETFDLNQRLEKMSELLQQILGSKVEVVNRFAEDLWPVRCDPGQLEVALVNLAVNARDAMPEGGVLTLETRNLQHAPPPEGEPGQYVSIRVRDTGLGMSPAVMARAFEPFFTTKGAGKGTGLGLAQVFGFVKQSGGDICIDSEPGRGTDLVFVLPRALEAASLPPPECPVVGTLVSSAQRRVLVVDDNAEARDFAIQLLEELGYRTLAAASAAEALALLQEGEEVDVVFSDVVMPGSISGIELAETLRAHHPEVAVILATGYSEHLVRQGPPRGVRMLTKPYMLDDLAAALQRALLQAAPSEARS